ncbi:hypothetical protein H4R21_002956 [Coemansia helicoidea]|uniref:Uncharacterized protein n=1 Tax=Coemansia helicoidea TaxID=1286919 RepID=A0ACC1L513_9FUNG|nr:hypothetical protein H4R21_002956 [Coemansia helicoidea]
MAEMDMLVDKLDAQFGGGTIFSRRVRAASTLAAQRMRTASGRVRERLGWLEEAGSVAGAGAWRALLRGLTEQEAGAVVDELRFFASLHKRDTDIRLTPVDGVWGSTARVGPQLMAELDRWANLVAEDAAEEGRRRYLERRRPSSTRAVQWLDDEDSEDSEDNEGEGPAAGRRGQVVYLVDPCMHPLIYSASTLVQTGSMTLASALRPEVAGWTPGSAAAWQRALLDGRGSGSSRTSTGRQRALYVPVGPDWAVSGEHCWLPAEFQLDRRGRATVQSYINGLNPDRFAGLYATIERVFALLVPVLEQVLTDLAHPRGARAPSTLGKWWTNGSDSDSDASCAAAGRSRAWAQFSARLEDPRPRPPSGPARPIIPYTLCGQRLQAVVEMSDIVLAPGRLAYRGQWTVDGMANERIIATAILHYAADNIARATIAFREPVQAVADCDSNSADAMGRIYGLAPTPGRPRRVSRPAGKVAIEAGACIVYPNTYQHRSTARLVDPRRPGVLRRLVIYFVDPSTWIPSTELVPPQQRNWLRPGGDVVVRGMYLMRRYSSLSRLSITPAIAKQVCDAMVAEHVQATAELNKALFEPVLQAS